MTPNYSFRQRRQDQAYKRVEENGSIYACTAPVILSMRCRIGGNVGTHVMHPLDSFQVDSEDDLDLIESLLPLRVQWQDNVISSTSTA